METDQAQTTDVKTVSSILQEAAGWLIEGEPAGNLRYQLEDKEYWDLVARCQFDLESL